MPVLVWLGVIALESSDVGSSKHTGRLISYIWTALFGATDPATLETVNAVLRKSGHVTGYAILSWLIFRALRKAWLNRNGLGMQRIWRFGWAAAGVVGTLLAASADEFHQSFNPARTGTWHDVVLDVAAGMAMQILLYLSRQRQSPASAYADAG